MPDKPPDSVRAPDAHALSRTVVRRDMLRANTAVGAVLLVFVALAFVAVLAGLRASRNLERAQAAESASKERLWKSYLAQARAMRMTSEPNRRRAALAVVRNAVAIRTSSELRTEAIACLALPELEPEGQLISTPRDLEGIEMDWQLQRVAYGDAQGNVFLCRLQSGEPLFRLDARELGPGTRMPVGDLAFSPDGHWLAARFEGGAVAIWDLEQRRCLASTGVSGTNVSMTGLSFMALTSLSFSPDSKRLFFSDAETQGRISELDLATGRKTVSPIQSGLKVFRVRPDMKQAAIAIANDIQLIDYPSGANPRSLNHAARVTALAWSPDSTRLLASCENGDLYLWDVNDGTHHVLTGHSERCMLLGFSPNGRRMFSSSRDGTSRVWDANLFQPVAAAEGMAHRFSPDGTRLGYWKPWIGAGVWRISTSSNYCLLPCAKSEGPLFTLDLSPSGRWCAATQNTGFRVWDLQADVKEYFFREPEVYCVRVAPDEKSLLLCRKTGLEVRPLLTNNTGGLDLSPTNAKCIALPSQCGARGVALSQNGNMLAVELTDKRLVVIDLVSNKAPVFIKGRCRTVNYKGPASLTGGGRFALSPDGRWLATGFNFGEDDIPCVWDTQSGELAATLKAETSVVSFSPDGHWLGLAGMENYSIWSVGNWQCREDFKRDEMSITHGTLAFSGNGALFAVARTRRSVQLREPFTGRVHAELIPPVSESVNSIRLSLDGSTLATATASDMVEIWNLKSLRRDLDAMHLNWENEPETLAFSSIAHLSPATWSTTLLASLGGLLLAVAFAALTLRWHRLAIERFVTAEAKAAQHDRELEMAKVELMHSQKMRALGTLAAGIAHDFNNLLSVIRMSSKLIGRDVPGNPVVADHVADIEQAILQGKNVVGSMLGYARDDNTAPAPTDISAVVEETVSLLSKEFLSGIALTLELDPSVQPVVVSRGRLEQIMLNLIVNASEAMQGEGKLTISVHCRPPLSGRELILKPREANEYLELSVIDSGPGISPAMHEQIFEPFFTTKRTGARPGTGLGLSLVYSIAQQEQFGLGLESEPDKGAAFILIIPA